MSTTRTISGFILAGGRSTRIGHDKALLDWHGVTLLDHMKQLLSGVCDTVRIIGPNGLPDDVPGLGPIGGIATALNHTATRFNLITAVDLPCLTIDFLIHFRERCIRSSSPLTVCKVESGFPLCLGMRAELTEPVETYIHSGKRSMIGLIERTDHEVVTGVDWRLFANINTLADYERELNRYKS